MMMKPNLLVLIVLLLVYARSDARPTDIKQSETASRLTRVASGVQMAADVLCSLTAPSWWYSKEVITPTTISVYFVGLPRTGTTSIAAAMNILGYKVLHDDEGPNVIDLCGSYHRGEIDQDELHHQFGQRGYNCSFYSNHHKWAGQNKNVKVVLTTRDPDKWADSFLTVATIPDIWQQRPFVWIPSLREIKPMLDEIMKEQPTGGDPEGYLDRDVLVRGYQVHSQNVREAVPADRLLEFSVKDGWGPLCDFLKVPVPDVPFPYINDRVRIAAVVMVLKAITWIWPLAFLLPILCFKWLMQLFSREDNAKKVKTVMIEVGLS